MPGPSDIDKGLVGSKPDPIQNFVTSFTDDPLQLNHLQTYSNSITNQIITFLFFWVFSSFAPAVRKQRCQQQNFSTSLQNAKFSSFLFKKAFLRSLWDKNNLQMKHVEIANMQNILFHPFAYLDCANAILFKLMSTAGWNENKITFYFENSFPVLLWQKIDLLLTKKNREQIKWFFSLFDTPVLFRMLKGKLAMPRCRGEVKN
jgi:hypothetical protein